MERIFFHTSNKKVWDFVNSITPFRNFINSLIANYKGSLYNLPFNMNTFYQLWKVTTPEQAKAKIKEQTQNAINSLNSRAPMNLEEQALCLVGQDIYNILIKEYTEKQWGRKCTELPAFIIKRLPIRYTFDNNYFNDTYQGIPTDGYNALIDRLLNGIDTMTNVDFFSHRKQLTEIADKIVYTGRLDEFFDYKFGKLNWRTVSFKTYIKDTPNFQGNAVVNYTSNDVPYTRIIEHKHFEKSGYEIYENHKTVISEEFSTEYRDGMEPYYPVNDEFNNKLAERYKIEAAKQKNVIFGGRLAEYKYYDMAPIIEKVMNLFSI